MNGGDDGDEEHNVARNPHEGLRILARLIAAQIRAGAEPPEPMSVKRPTRGRPRTAIRAVSVYAVPKKAA